MNDTKIEWADDTVNPWIGCSKVSPACKNCYAEALDKRLTFGGRTNWGKDAPRLIRVEKAIAELERIAKRGDKDGRPRKVFIASMADVFEDRADLVEPRLALWHALCRINAERTRVIAMFLTKRPGMMLAFQREHVPDGMPSWAWCGTTVEDQEYAKKRVGDLLRVRVQAGGVRFVSCEPLLGPLDLSHIDIDDDGKDPWMCQVNALTGRHTDMFRPCPDVPRIGWVIAGGESGRNARPSHPDWFRSLRDQCQSAGVPFHFKQWGEYGPDRGSGAERVEEAGVLGVPPALNSRPEDVSARRMFRVGKKAAGRLLDGRTWDEVPR